MNDAGSPADTSTTPAAVTGPKPRPGMRATVGTAVATAALVAATVLSGSAATAATTAKPTVSERIAGVQQDMARAVSLQQITPAQAAFLERQLVQHMQPEI